MKIDCVVVGFNEMPIESFLKKYKGTRNFSGTYRHLLRQSIYFEGKRRSYSEVIASCIENATQKPCSLSIFEMPSFAVYYLSSYLRRKGIVAEPINFYNHDKNKLKRILLENNPDLVAISTSLYTESEPIQEIIAYIKRYNKKVKIIAGGIYVSGICNTTDYEQREWELCNIGADLYVNDFQGEETLSRVCQHLKDGNAELSDIPNLAYRNENNYVFTTRIPESNSLDDNPTEIMLESEKNFSAAFTRTSRSCPNRCSFCRYPFLGGEYTLQNFSSLKNQLDYFRKLGIKYLVFTDDTLNIPLDRFKDFCRMLISFKYNFKWFSYFRCSDADEEAFDLMKEAGCAGVFLGIESGNASILLNMNKSATIQQYQMGINQLKKRNIMTLGSFMIGFPGETKETAMDTIEFIKKVKPTYYSLQVYFHELVVPIANESEKYGLKSQGYSWYHNTMNWKEAGELVELGLNTIQESKYLPLYTFNIWSIAYYMSQGFTEEQINSFLELSGKMLVAGLKTDEPNYEELETQINNIFNPA